MRFVQRMYIYECVYDTHVWFTYIYIFIYIHIYIYIYLLTVNDVS